MRLKELTLHNFRGFNQPRTIDLDAQALLLYGPNGRGKSTVFTALELALCPAETLSELIQELGERAPMTNLFYQGNDPGRGEISITLEDDGGGTLTVRQEIRQELYSVSPAAESKALGLDGQRYRLFFTQRLLRDLMFGMPERRHERVKQLMGCDGYDSLLRTLYKWHRDGDYEFAQLDKQEKNLRAYDNLLKRLLKQTTRLDDWAAAAHSALDGRLDRFGVQKFEAVMRALFARLDRDLTEHIWPKTSFRTFHDLAKFTSEAALLCTKLLAEVQIMYFPPYPPDQQSYSRLPSAWRQELIQRVVRFTETEASFQIAVAPYLQAKPDLVRMERVLTSKDLFLLAASGLSPSEYAELEQRFTEMDVSEKQYLHQRSKLSSRVKRYQHRLNAFRQVAQTLTNADPAVEVLRQLDADSIQQAFNTLTHRRQFLNFTRTLYRVLLDLVDDELSARIVTVKERWNMYYRSISSFSHFQSLDLGLVTLRDTQGTEHWEIPPDKWSLIRFLVTDRDLRESSFTFSMETLLSEGQLNCAVVSLILALTGADGDVELPSVRLLALDDPFVSWDDVNMENFMLALRRMTATGTTVLISTCDQRVVHSLRSNLETIHLNRGALIYTFTGWDKQHGPSFETERIERHMPEIRYLSDLPPGEFEGTPLRPEELPESTNETKQPTGRPGAPSSLYYILTTKDADCHRNLVERGRFDHIYLRQADSRSLLQYAETSKDRRPEVHFIYYDRMHGSPDFHKLMAIYRLVDIREDHEAGLSPFGHPMYSLLLKKLDQVGRPFTPGTALWESLLTTRGKVLKNFFFRNARVLIRISEQEYNTILGLR